eukprot:COSAG02_NODE_12048_length_1607_cov_1.685013_1_plen_330_part_10
MLRSTGGLVDNAGQGGLGRRHECVHTHDDVGDVILRSLTVLDRWSDWLCDWHGWAVMVSGGAPHGDERLRSLGFVPGRSFRRTMSASPGKEGGRRAVPPLDGRKPASPRSPTVAETSGIFAKLTDPDQYTGSHRHRFHADGTGRGLAGRDRVRKGAGSVAVDDGFEPLLRPELREVPSTGVATNRASSPKFKSSILRGPGGRSPGGSAAQPAGSRDMHRDGVGRLAANLGEPVQSPQRVVWTGWSSPQPLETAAVAMSPRAAVSPGEMVAQRRKQHQVLRRACTHIRLYHLAQAWKTWAAVVEAAREVAGYALRKLMNRQLAKAWQCWAA